MNSPQLLKLLVETESPSHDKSAVDRVGAIVAEEARKLGAQVEIIPNKETGDHVLVRFSSNLQPSTLNLQPILLLCHMDTVFPLGTLSKMPRALVEKYLAPLRAQQADILVLGCTHFPFLAPLIQEIAGPAVFLIDPSPAVARELRRRLTHAGLLSVENRTGITRFWYSALPAKTQQVMTQLWGGEIEICSMTNPVDFPDKKQLIG